MALAMSWNDGVVIDDVETAPPLVAGCGDIPYSCQYSYEYDGWVHAAASSPSSSSVLTFDGGHGADEYTAASWMNMDMDSHGTDPQLISYGSTAATATSTCCLTFDTATTLVTAVSGSQKRPRPPPPSQGAEANESKKYKKHRMVDMVTMLDKAISYVKFMQLQLRVLQTDAFWPSPDGTAPDVSQVNHALHAIITQQQPPSCQFS
uniref:BHLH domain-containing protein n=1 Tax=Leersia perrieri TaxID=77586 RepID=A0A0D9WPZ3_9ORYZ